MSHFAVRRVGGLSSCTIASSAHAMRSPDMSRRRKRCVSVPPDNGLRSSNGVGIAASRLVRSRTFPVTALLERTGLVPLAIEEPAALYPRGHVPLECRKHRTGDYSCARASHDEQQLLQPRGLRNFIIIDEREQLCPDSPCAVDARIARERNSATRLVHVFDRPADRASQRVTRCSGGCRGIVVRHHDRDGARRTARELEGGEPPEDARVRADGSALRHRSRPTACPEWIRARSPPARALPTAEPRRSDMTPTTR